MSDPRSAESPPSAEEPRNGGGGTEAAFNESGEARESAPLLTEEESSAEIVVPVVAEELSVERQQVQTGGVRIAKRVHEEEKTVDEPGFAEEVEVKRVPVGRVLKAPAEVRHEGNTLIVPVMEEILVVEKRLVLKEEIHITRRRRTVHNPQRVILRREEAQVERLDSPQAKGNKGEEHDVP